MSAFYKSVSQRFPSGEQFDSDVVRRLILESVNVKTARSIEDSSRSKGVDLLGVDVACALRGNGGDVSGPDGRSLQ